MNPILRRTAHAVHGVLLAIGSASRFVTEPRFEPPDEWFHPADAQRYLSETEARQGSYLAASGTLTQFNAILTGILGAALVTVEAGTLKVAIAIALLLHVLAAFFLFWAARPVTAEREPMRAMALVGQYGLVDHTFRNYRRGWWMTLIALMASAVVAALFVLHTFGIAVPDVRAAFR